MCLLRSYLPLLLPFFFSLSRRPPGATLFPYTTLFRSIVGIVALAPLLGLIALLIKLDSCGPVFFVQDRVGMSAKRFRLRSEEHTSELQSHSDLVCRLLLEKKKKN